MIGLIPMRRVLMAALVLSCMPVGPAAARTLDQPPAYIQKEGNFVAYPARVVGGIGVLAGGLLALPAALVSTPVGFMAGDPLGYSILPSAVVGNGVGEIGYHVGGAIPYLVKKTFYDGPQYVVHAIKGDALSGMVADVEPPPEFAPIDLQYLASTPVDARLPVNNQRSYSIALPPPRQPASLMLRRQLSPFRLPTPAGVPPADRAALVKPSPAPAAETAAETARPTVEAAVVGLPPMAPGAAPPEQKPTPGEEGEVASSPTPERPSLRKKKRKFSERFSF